jgi:hypothetical protein
VMRGLARVRARRRCKRLGRPFHRFQRYGRASTCRFFPLDET